MSSREWRERHKKKCLDCNSMIHGVSLRCSICSPRFLFGGKIISDTHRLNLSKSHLGQIAWNKGKKLSNEFREKMRLIQLGRRLSEETKRKMSETHKNIPPHPNSLLALKIAVQKRTGKARYEQRGENAYQWKGGKSKERELFAHRIEYRTWRKSVFERDNYTCQWCKKRNCYLEADHIKMWVLYPNLRLDINNGQTLCEECHAWKTKMDKTIYFDKDWNNKTTCAIS